MDEAKLHKTVKFMRKNGLLKFKSDEIELELDPKALVKRPKREPLTAAEKLAEEQAQQRALQIQALMADPMAVLFWSSGMSEEDYA